MLAMWRFAKVVDRPRPKASAIGEVAVNEWNAWRLAGVYIPKCAAIATTWSTVRIRTGQFSGSYEQWGLSATTCLWILPRKVQKVAKHKFSASLADVHPDREESNRIINIECNRSVVPSIKHAQLDSRRDENLIRTEHSSDWVSRTLLVQIHIH